MTMYAFPAQHPKVRINTSVIAEWMKEAGVSRTVIARRCMTNIATVQLWMDSLAEPEMWQGQVIAIMCNHRIFDIYLPPEPPAQEGVVVAFPTREEREARRLRRTPWKTVQDS